MKAWETTKIRHKLDKYDLLILPYFILYILLFLGIIDTEAIFNGKPFEMWNI